MSFIDRLRASSKELKEEAEKEGIDQYYEKKKRDLVDALSDVSEVEEFLLFADTHRQEETWSKAIYGIASDLDLTGRGGMSTPDLIEALLDEFSPEEIYGLSDPNEEPSEESSSKENSGTDDASGSSSASDQENSHKEKRPKGGRELTDEGEEVRRHELVKALQAASRNAVEQERSQAVFEDRSTHTPENMFRVRPAYMGWDETEDEPIAMIHISGFAFFPDHE